MENRNTGTREWAQSTVNCVTGCSHNCRYCYARHNAVDRFKRVAANNWSTMVVRDADVRKNRGKKQGVIMFPSAHDITPEVLEPCLTVLEKLLAADNEVLLVSKPHDAVIAEIVKRFRLATDLLRFRFTIGSPNDSILKFWEPGAPTFAERLRALELAFNAGFKTSISAEPLIDPADVKTLWDELIPCVNWEFWIGKMNKTNLRVDTSDVETRMMMTPILEGQTDERVMEIYRMFKDEPLIQWKDSYKEVIERCGSE